MTRFSLQGISGLVAAIGIASALMLLDKQYPWPYPSLGSLIITNTGIQDAALITAGARSIAADLAWIQLLHFMADPTLLVEGSRSEKKSEDLYTLALRTVRIDPYFNQAVLYGAGILAFFPQFNSPDKALQLLEEAISYQPQYWPYRTLAGAIGYKNQNQFDNMVRLLEDAITHPECPVMTKSILANAYKSHRRDADARRLWTLLLTDSRASDYHDKARRELAILDGALIP